jgi:hypothetical protein
MEYNRARVAITLPGPVPGMEMEDWSGLVIHIGHARTLVLGDLISKEFGCPFHVRLDQCWASEINMGPSILDVSECLRFLRIVPDRVYIVPGISSSEKMHEVWESSGVKNVDKLIRLIDLEAIHTTQAAMLHDDQVVYHPSLRVRGYEFTRSKGLLPPNMALSIGAVIRQEELFTEVTGIPHYETSVPLITVQGCKLSKTASRVIHWSSLRSATPESARKFLVATALHSQDPLSALEWPFASGALERRNYEWSWEIWGKFLKRYDHAKFE